MTTDDKLSMAVSCCLCCTLAEAMKDCPNCAFRIGLAIKALQYQETGALKPSARAEFIRRIREINSNQSFITA